MTRWAPLSLILSFPVLLVAQIAAPARYPVTENVVSLALRASGIDVEPSRVHLPTRLSAATASPELEITASERVADGRVRLHLRCRKAGDCLPFNVTLDLHSDVVVAAEAGTLHEVSAISAQANVVEAKTPVATRELARPANSGLQENDASLRVGSRVSLIIEDSRMRIRLPVIAIDSGGIGSDVRVCTPDHKKTFHATVVDPTTVRGAVE
jgi:flagella basal body P-ring formation protein FlgA